MQIVMISGAQACVTANAAHFQNHLTLSIELQLIIGHVQFILWKLHDDFMQIS